MVGVELTAAYKVSNEDRAIADAAPDPRAEERAVVARAQAGDLEAFEVLYRANLGRVYALCYRMAGNSATAVPFPVQTPRGRVASQWLAWNLRRRTRLAMRTDP